MTPDATMSATNGNLKVGFFFWPRDTETVMQMGRLAEEHGYDMVGVADSPGNCVDCWVSATLLSVAAPTIPLTICVSNFVSRHWTTSGSAAASLAMAHRPGFVLGMGAGHSAVRNFGLTGSTVNEMAHDLEATLRLVRGEAVPSGTGDAHLPWMRERPRVFLAASHEPSLRLAGSLADGVFVNYGLRAENIAESAAQVARGSVLTGNDPEIWQVAALDCAEDGAEARAAIGKICAFIAGYVIGKRDPAKRGVPPEHVDALRELVQLYSTRPSQADTDLVARLGLSDYLTRRVAICGDPDECLTQLRAASQAGAKAVMFSVAQSSDPLKTVDLLGRHVLPALRADASTAAAATMIHAT
ncbi:MAG TPA: LLM class flavin-dependent oxidoreductase [Pseudonocardia sp.]